MFAPVYLDHNATTPLDPRVLEAMLPYLSERFGNASSRHEYGRAARMAIDEARGQVAAAVGAHPTEVIFTGSGSEANNLFLKGAAACLKPGVLAVSAVEHPSMREPARDLARQGWRLQEIGVDGQGRISAAAYREALAAKPRLVSVILANNETGVLQPVDEIGKIAAEAGVFFHIDAVQGAGKVPFDVRRFRCHLLSISAHKMHGPKGVGALFVRRGTPLESMIVGGSHERRRRAGTENVPGIVGLARAAELAMHSLADGTLDRVASLRDRLETELLSLPGTGLNGSGTDGKPVPRAANTSNIWFDQLEGEALVIALDLKGVAVSGGSACHSGATEPSHVLMAMGLDKNRARASLRFSLLKTATEADVDHVLRVVPEAVEQLRALSPVAAGTLG